jgi:hypothetical protein
MEEKTTANKRNSKFGFLCSFKHLISLHTFPEKSEQVVLADFEQQFIPALAIASAGRCKLISRASTNINRLTNK